MGSISEQVDKSEATATALLKSVDFREFISSLHQQMAVDLKDLIWSIS